MPLSTDITTTTTTTTTIMARPAGHTQSQSQHVHKRRSSKDSDDELLATAHRRPPLVSPVRTSFHMAPGHSRTRSISAFSPLSPSPLSVSFPLNPISSSLSKSSSAPEIETPSNPEPLKQPPSRRSHNRIHSRNLSIFFPRPGPLPTNSISELEDGTQEVSLPDSSPVDGESGRFAQSSENSATDASPDRMRKPLTPLGQGFTFGSKPPSSTLAMGTNATQPDQLHSTRLTRTRRGHHHKHSLSHNFFSFLEPGSTSLPPSSSDRTRTSPGHDPELHTQPVPVPVSSWGTKLNSSIGSQTSDREGSSFYHPLPLVVSPTFANALSITNLCLGATLWVRGQQAGSLACTGLGYWVVFDAIGLALSRDFDFGLGFVVNRLEGRGTGNRNLMMIRRPYGAARLSTLLTFAQSVYLMFSAVYVCKETIEHILLSTGEGHHHHAGDESAGAGLELPLILTSITLVLLLGSAVLFDHNSEIVNITQTRIPPLPVLLRTIRSFFSRSNSQDYHDSSFPPRFRVSRALSNPFVLSPLIFCMGILAIGNLVSSPHQRLMDLLLASLIAFITFNLAYRACVVLGTVLLQTSPARTNSQKGRVTIGREGQMESFLRAMREVERHPHVLHLPAPHIWQIAPGSPKLSSPSSNQTSNLVVTLEIHVRPELGDEDVLELTRWAWERVVVALGGSPKSPDLSEQKKLEGKEDGRREEPECGRPEVTVGIIRG